MKASDIADAVSAMEQASNFIAQNVNGGVLGGGDLRYKLIKSACRLGSYLAVIDVKIEKDQTGGNQ
jgi:hypothetical protein